MNWSLDHAPRPRRDWKSRLRRFFVGAFWLTVLITTALIALGALLA